MSTAYQNEEKTRRRAAWFAGLAFIVSGLGIYSTLQGYRRQLEGGEKLEVLSVTRDVEPGTSLVQEDITMVRVPQAYVDERRLRAADLKTILGVPLRTRVRAGEGLYWSDWVQTEKGEQALAQTISPGKRIYQLNDAANPFRHRLQVGDRVDVLLAHASRVEQVVQNVLVVAVGESSPGKSDSSVWMRPSGVSLSVTPDEAERLLLAERTGPLRIVLRHPEDWLESERLQESEKVVGRMRTDRRREIERVQ